VDSDYLFGNQGGMRFPGPGCTSGGNALLAQWLFDTLARGKTLTFWLMLSFIVSLWAERGFSAQFERIDIVSAFDPELELFRWFVAMVKSPARYLYYKDVNRPAI
jgi:hypothetical protein